MLGHASARENEVAITILSATGKRNPSIANVPPGESKWKREQRLRLEAEKKQFTGAA